MLQNNDIPSYIEHKMEETAADTGIQETINTSQDMVVMRNRPQLSIFIPNDGNREVPIENVYLDNDKNIIKTKNANINLDTNLCTPLQQQNTQHEEEYWKKKYKVWKELADSGNSIAAQNIGIALYKGECGIQQDLSGAVYYFQMAANLGQPNSMFNLGWAYASGMGVPQSWQHAIRWWKLACFYGHGSAARNLGLLYTLGMIDITDDPSYMSCPTEKIDLYQKYNGFYYYLRAAELGNIKGMMALENCYRYGIGCKRDIELADFWYHRVINSSTSIQQKKVDAQHLTSSSTYTLQNSPRDDTFEESFQDKNPNLLNNICTNRPI